MSFRCAAHAPTSHINNRNYIIMYRRVLAAYLLGIVNRITVVTCISHRGCPLNNNYGDIPINFKRFFFDRKVDVIGYPTITLCYRTISCLIVCKLGHLLHPFDPSRFRFLYTINLRSEQHLKLRHSKILTPFNEICKKIKHLLN